MIAAQVEEGCTDGRACALHRQQQGEYPAKTLDDDGILC